MSAFTDLLPIWLSVTRDGEVATGMPREKALANAAELIASGKLFEHVESAISVDDESKDVLYALVELVEQASRANNSRVFKVADGAYRYVRSMLWAPDDFGERRSLMRACAAVGWRALGIDIELVEAKRRKAPPGRAISFEVLLPANSPEYPDDVRERVGACSRLGTLVDDQPTAVASGLMCIYEYLESSEETFRVLDLREYLLGACALIVASSLRVTGSTDEAEGWLRRAEKYFSATTDSEPLMAKLACERLAWLADRLEYRSVCLFSAEVIALTSRLGLRRDHLRSRLIEAIALRTRGVNTEAVAKLTALAADPELVAEPVLRNAALVNLADALTCEGRLGEAELTIAKAYEDLDSRSSIASRAVLEGTAAQLLRRQGRLPEAIRKFRTSAIAYSAAGMRHQESAIQISTAETLIAAGRYREAEAEILLALPVLEKFEFVAEGIAAVALLKEAARMRKADVETLPQSRDRY